MQFRQLVHFCHCAFPYRPPWKIALPRSEEPASDKALKDWLEKHGKRHFLAALF
jgi:hypothetical protein